MGISVTKVRCVFQRPLVVPVIMASTVREEHMRLLLSYRISYRAFLYIHVSYGHCAILVAALIDTICRAFLTDSHLRHNPMVVTTYYSLTNPLEFFGLQR